MSRELDLMPVQSNRRSGPALIRKEVVMKAYEVYRDVYGPQEAMITGNCRGGFSTGELIAFLYAHNFPREEWSRRVDEAFEGSQNL